MPTASVPFTLSNYHYSKFLYSISLTISYSHTSPSAYCFHQQTEYALAPNTDFESVCSLLKSSLVLSSESRSIRNLQPFVPMYGIPYNGTFRRSGILKSGTKNGTLRTIFVRKVRTPLKAALAKLERASGSRLVFLLRCDIMPFSTIKVEVTLYPQRLWLRLPASD